MLEDDDEPRFEDCNQYGLTLSQAEVLCACVREMTIDLGAKFLFEEVAPFLANELSFDVGDMWQRLALNELPAVPERLAPFCYLGSKNLERIFDDSLFFVRLDDVALAQVEQIGWALLKLEMATQKQGSA